MNAPDASGGRADPLDMGEILAHQGFVRGLARSLAGGGADDLVQETWVHLLERAPERPRRLRSWLAKVVLHLARDRRRGEERRVARELEAARAPAPASRAAGSTSELVQRMELHRRLVELVLSLEPAGREIVLLHHFEGLTVAAAAQRLGIPFETAKTRLRRALASLRERLDRELGGRDAALAALLPLARFDLPLAPIGATATASTATGGATSAGATTTVAGAAAAGSLLGAPILMTTTGKLLLAAASVAVVGGLVLWNLDGRTIPPGDRDARVAAGSSLPEPATVGDAPIAPSRDAPAAPERTPLDAPATSDAIGPISPAHAALLVKTIWKSDGSPAPRAPLRLVARDADARFPEARRVRTDEKGELLLRDVAPGEIEVAAAGFASGAEESKECVQALTLAAGERGDVTLALWDAMPLAGEVVDQAGKPVADAEIWVGDRANDACCDGVLAATSDERGLFELRAVGLQVYLAARAPGFATSDAVMASSLRRGEERRIRLVVGGEEARLRGRVFDPEGAPLAGALVVVDAEEGSSRLLDDGSIADRPPPRVARTDADGRFELDGLGAGDVVVLARTERHPPVAASLRLRPGETAERDLQLRRAGALEGRVNDAQGAAIPGAQLFTLTWLGNRLFQLAESATRSDEEGRYAFASLPPGPVTLRVNAGAAGSKNLQLEIPEGGVLRRDVLLERGPTLRGRVIDERRRPLAGMRIQAQPGSGGAPRIPEAVASDAEGRFEIPDLDEQEWSLTVEDPQDLHVILLRRTARPGGDEVELVIGAEQRATATIEGRLLDPDGRPASALVSIWQVDSNSIRSLRVDERGCFGLGPLPPGRYRVWAAADGCAPIEFGELELAPEQQLDLGERRFARPAALVLRVERADGAAIAAGDVALRRAKDDRGDDGAVELAASGRELRASALAPGDYVVEVIGAGLARRRIPVTLNAGATTTLDLHVEPGVSCRFVITRDHEAGDALPLAGRHEWTARGPEGAELRGTLTGAADAKSLDLSLCLAPGAWSLTVTAADGARAQTTFEASRRSSDGEPVLLLLRRCAR
jgi:RNA polymerase sigma-70 factor (ECF subfamily)